MIELTFEATPTLCMAAAAALTSKPRCANAVRYRPATASVLEATAEAAWTLPDVVLKVPVVLRYRG